MAPPGRRRSPLSILSVVLCLLLFSQSALAISAVLGVDLGTEYIKAVLVKPGTPLEIVLSKDSKRKDTSIVAFKTPKVAVAAESYPERFYGSAAEALAPRFPGDVYPNLKQLLGLPAEGSTVVAQYKERYPGLRLVQSDTRSAPAFKSPSFSKDERAFAVEELLATVLRSVKSNAQTLAGKSHKVEAVVFTIPPFYTIEEKSALELAADLAGLKAMSVVTDGVAVGINYATSRTFESINDGAKPEYHMVFDVGAGYTTSTILKMQGRTIKDVGKFNKTIQEVIVMGTGWDRTLGGDALNHAIVRDMASKFIETPAGSKLGKTAQDVLSSGRASARMRKDAQRLRQVLSANQESSASFEELYQDVDFKYKLSRADYESLTTSFAERLDAPFTAALKAANLSAADLDSIILHGGAIRTPFVQKRLETLAGDASKLRSNVNSDEAAAFGAAFKAARLSPSFRVKDIRDYDAAIYPTWMQYQKGKESKTSQQKIFSASSYTGATKVVTLPKLDDFEIYLFQKRPTDPGSPYEAGDKGSTGTRFQSQNLTGSVEKLVKDKGCKKEEIKTQVTVRLDPIWGRPEVVSGSVSCEVEVVEKKGVLGDVKDFLGLGKKDQKVLEQSSASPSSSSSSSTSTGSSSGESAEASSKPKDDTKELPKPEVKPKKMKTETIKFEFDAQHDRIAVIPFPEHKFMAERIRAFDKSDSDRLTREEDLNNLESKIYRIRDQLEDTEFTSFASAPMIKDVQRLVKSTSQWLSDSGHDATSEVLKERRKALEEIVAPIALRRSEAAKRPELTKLLRDALSQAKGLVTMIEDSINVAARRSSELAEASASSSSSASEASSATDPLADLEQPESSASPQPTDNPLSFLPVYTADDLKTVKGAYESTNAWFEKKLAEQEKLLPYEDAVFTSTDLEAKAKELNDGLMKLLQQKLKATENAAKAQEKVRKAQEKKEKKEKAEKKKAEKKAKEEESKATESQTEDKSSSTTEAASKSSGKDEL